MSDMVDSKKFQELVKNIDINITNLQLEKLEIYLNMLVQYNKVMNLVSYKKWEHILNILIFDSVYLCKFINSLTLPKNILSFDLGSGAGLPGIPLRIMWNKGIYNMIEIREKRATFIANCLSSLKLQNTFIVPHRVEDFFKTINSKANLIISRAFMPWEKLLDLTYDYLDENGFLIILALKEAPLNLPSLWKCGFQYEYIINKNKRYFWALSKVVIND